MGGGGETICGKEASLYEKEGSEENMFTEREREREGLKVFPLRILLLSSRMISYFPLFFLVGPIGNGLENRTVRMRRENAVRCIGCRGVGGEDRSGRG